MAAEKEPVILTGRTIARTWWGKSWCKNLESYADYSNRIARGRSYIRDGTILDLKISEGNVTASVQGSRSRPYKVRIDIDRISGARRDNLVARCGNRIESLDALLSGDIPDDVANIFISRDGLFPSSGEIVFNCTCPDSAYMCKHVAATLYGIGARFDADPTLFFRLRGVDTETLVRKSVEDRMANMLRGADRRTARMLDDEDLNRLFGVLDQK
jgi:uncharacterized Zn finger protein